MWRKYGFREDVDMTKETDPIRLFQEYFEAAKKSEPSDATAFALATADGDGAPSVRMVLLKKAEAEGFMFFTNLESRKGEDLQANPKAAMCFYWDTIDIQVRIEGKVTPVTSEEAGCLFRNKAKGKPDRNLGVGSVTSDGGECWRWRSAPLNSLPSTP